MLFGYAMFWLAAIGVPLITAVRAKDVYDTGLGGQVALFMMMSAPVLYLFYIPFYPLLIYATGLTWLLAWMAYIDAHEYVVDDLHTLGVLVWSFLANIFVLGEWQRAFWGILGAGIFMAAIRAVSWLLFRKKYADDDYGFGSGDLLIFIALGAWFGVRLLSVFVLAAMICIVMIVPLILLGLRERSEPIPFVGFIYLGVVAAFILGLGEPFSGPAFLDMALWYTGFTQ